MEESLIWGEIMYSAFIRKELLCNMLSLRYGLTLALCVIMTLSATMIRTSLYKKHNADYQQGLIQRDGLLSAVQKNWGLIDGLGTTIEKGPNPLAIFVSGLENEMTRSFSISGWIPPKTGKRKLSNPSFQYSLQFDLILIINLVGSLLALLFMFDAICGEREQGTLKVLLSGPLPRDVIIVGKFLAGLVTVLVPLILSWLFSLSYVLIVAGVSLTGEQLERLVWIALLSAAFMSFFFALGAAVSTWVQRSATSLAICLFCWIMLVLAIPNGVPMVVKHVSPIPPQTKMRVEKEAIHRAVQTEYEPKIREELGASGKYTTEDGVRQMQYDLQRLLSEERQRREVQVDRFYNSLISQQLVLNQQISRVSPSASFMYATAHLSGSGAQDFAKLLTSVDQYQAEILEAKTTLKNQYEQKRKELEKDPQAQAQLIAVRHEDLPRFNPQNISQTAALNGSWLDFALLVGGTILLLLLGFVGFLRYDVHQ